MYSCSVAKSCLTLRPHELRYTRSPHPSLSPEFAQTHVHSVNDAIQSSQSLLSPSPPALTLPQRKSLFQGVSSFHQVAEVLAIAIRQEK